MDTTSSEVSAPFSKDQLRQDVLTIFWMQVRLTTLFVDNARIWALLARPVEREGLLWDMDRVPADFDLTYAAVASSTFAQAMEQQYDFAFLGVRTDLLEPMEYETMHTWVAAYLLDLMTSRFVEESESFGQDLHSAIQRCLHTSELANARLVLEGKENFAYFNSAQHDGKQDEPTALNALTIRQIALLAGMEEMSVRTAASRKGPNQLQTFKEDTRTLVRVEDARVWLKARGKYVPITRSWQGRELRLDQTKFESVGELDQALQNQLGYVKSLPSTQGDPSALLSQAFEQSGLGSFFVVTAEVTGNRDLLTKIAGVLQLPSDLLILRAEQAQLNNDLYYLERRIAQRLDSTLTVESEDGGP